jgi:ABC-type uncharacterized transport system ATPase subunit
VVTDPPCEGASPWPVEPTSGWRAWGSATAGSRPWPIWTWDHRAAGANGAGKTTLIRILATLLAPSAGQVHVNGWQTASPGDRVQIRRRLGYLPQDLGLYPRFTVFAFVDYLAILKELDDAAERHRRVRAALEAVALEDLAGCRIRTLSGGMRRRVGILPVSELPGRRP